MHAMPLLTKVRGRRRSQSGIHRVFPEMLIQTEGFKNYAKMPKNLIMNYRMVLEMFQMCMKKSFSGSYL